jgi:hypothetical protein
VSGYAENTSVPVERSRAEIEQLLRRYGADQFLSGWDVCGAMIGFQAQGRQIRLYLPNPIPEEFNQTPTGRRRNPADARRASEQEHRRRWRALALVIKAKLEAVASGITTFEQEFLAHVVLPDGSTVGQWATPQLERSYADGSMPKGFAGLLEAPGDAKR